jgi:DNA-binding transcriptional LysR family regulator
MDFRDLRYFEAIAELLHVGQAAQKLHRTQPALTSSIRRLEEECGFPLFERAGRGIRLTAAGQVLLKWAQRVRFDMQDAKLEMAAIGSGLAGHVRIGIVPTAAQFLLPAAARLLLQEGPDITLRTVVGLVDQLKPLLAQGELDMVVSTETHSELQAPGGRRHRRGRERQTRTLSPSTDAQGPDEIPMGAAASRGTLA